MTVVAVQRCTRMSGQTSATNGANTGDGRPQRFSVTPGAPPSAASTTSSPTNARRSRSRRDCRRAAVCGGAICRARTAHGTVDRVGSPNLPSWTDTVDPGRSATYASVTGCPLYRRR